MKKLLAIALIAGSLACGIGGCTSNKIQVIDNKNVVTNTVPLKAFNDESYIWENWTFGTNTTEVINK